METLEHADFPPTPQEILFSQIYKEAVPEVVEEQDDYGYRDWDGTKRGSKGWKAHDGILKRLSVGDEIIVESHKEATYMYDRGLALGIKLSNRKGVLTRVA